ncbi:hypothetical protein H6P81_000271 [Aristolochia fimbriata]|uniref:Uncharacterized protein n=1 Tax=Aristolochia fimbriata TaxID=158543 RepID=A0AAV7F860_ARIFI|nr:hypothetical protein H6P81_000271 [Aristolochia fimbriata]
MLLRSASTPILNSWIPCRDASPEPDFFPTPGTKARSVSVPSPLSASSPGYDSSRISSFRMSRALSETDLRDLALPPPIPRAKSRTHKSLPAAPVKECEEEEEEEEGGMDSAPSLARLFSSSGLDELVESGEACYLEGKGRLSPLLEGGGFGGGNGGICGGKGGGGNGGDGDGGWGFSDSNSGHGSTDAYYQRMIEADPGNALLLTNYAKFLKEVRGDLVKSEEFCARAILANPGDGDVLSFYGNLIWERQKDAQRAESYFDQAVQAEPDNCYVMASYARFLWDAEEEEEEEDQEKTQSASLYRGAVAHHHPLAAAS